MTILTTYRLRLPKSIKAEAEALSKADGISLNQFVATAVAEKIAVLKTAAYFDERTERAQAAARRGKPSALLAALSRSGGEPLRAGDELPETGLLLAARAAPTRKARAGAGVVPGKKPASTGRTGRKS